MFISCPIQSALYSLSRELVLTRIVGIVNRYCILIVETGFAGVAFLLFYILNSVPRTQGFELTSQLPKRNLNKVLVISFTNINFLLNTWIVTNNQFTYLMLNAMVNYQPSRFIQIVSDAIATPLIKSCLLMCEPFYILLIFLRLNR
ncbi:MAG: hypothetical protein RLZZ69_64 [Cyanobacteriota bacterium]